MDFPTRYVNLPAARAKHGERVERFGRFLTQGDALADGLVDALAARPRAARDALLDAALRGGIDAVPEAPDALRALVAQIEHVPFWVDRARIERGARAFLESGILGGMVLGAMSLVGGYCSPAGNKPLVFSGRLTDDVSRRLAETSQFVELVTAPHGLDLRAPGYRACVKVRLMHASVRRALQRSPRWQGDAWGVPINQADASGTLLLFSYTVALGLERLGYVMSHAEREDFLHVWRYAGWLLGVDPELLFATWREAETIWDVLTSTQEPPDDDARALARALIETGRLTAQPGDDEAARMKKVPMAYALSRHLLGDYYADHLGFPKSSWRHVFAGFQRANAAASARLRSLGPFGDFAYRKGLRHWHVATAIALGGTPASFSMPDPSAHAT